MKIHVPLLKRCLLAALLGAPAFMAAAQNYGKTPGLYSTQGIPAGTGGLSRLEFEVTPQNDPGPHSNVYWSNQVDALSGYTGLQTTVLVNDDGEGTGKQFLFSLWGATDFRTGTPASAGIGGGSFCTASGSATDGSAGVQCRYRFMWKAGHTYRFTVKPEPSLGLGWFSSRVADVGANSDGTSFVIGSIYQPSALKPTIDRVAISQWTEYFDWNIPTEQCSSVPYASVKFRTRAYDAAGAEIALPDPVVTANDTCAANFFSLGVSQGVATETGGPQQSAQGLFMVNGQCLTAQGGLPSGPGKQAKLVMGACPTDASVRARGGAYYEGSLFVMAADGSIQAVGGYCVSDASSGSAGVRAVVSICNGAARQRWQKQLTAAGTYQLRNAASNLCLAINGAGAVVSSACSSGNASWKLPGKSFSY